MIPSTIWTSSFWPFYTRAVWNTLRHAAPADVFDIAVVSIVLYFIFRLLSRARAVRVLQGVLIVGILYAFTRQMGLVLSTSLFHGVLMIATVSVAGLFQEDLRRFFERMTLYRTESIQDRTLRGLIRSIRHLVEKRHGALIVLKGRDLLDRFLEGGQVLNGHISGALLESLFDPHSDGHDGAVIIEGNVATHFGIHLPLSKNIHHESGLGTRHAAALGLAELTDAMCIVVSESRGTVMIAREGHLEKVGTGSLLDKRLQEFLQNQRDVSQARSHWTMVWNHPFEKCISILIGITLWLVVVKEVRPAVKVLTVPVEVEGESRWTILPPSARVTLRGLEKDLRAPASRMRILIQPIAGKRQKQTVLLSKEKVEAPSTLQVTSVIPHAVLMFKRSKVHPETEPVSPPRPAKRVWLKLR